MKNLLKPTKPLTIILFVLFFFQSCNNKEIFVIDQAVLVKEIPDEETEDDGEEEPNNEDEAPPIDAVDDSVTTVENIAVVIEAYLNDINLPATIIISNTNPSNGVLSINDNGTPDDIVDDLIVYTPNAGFSGTDSFEYTICDATNSDNCDVAIVTITVEPRENDFATELKAFPTAHGAGRLAYGGRGGKVLHVTSLADGTNSDVGTLRWALKQTYPRIIVFDVSGQINLNDWLTLEAQNDYLTVAGQTAPEGGITISGNVILYGGGYSTPAGEPMTQHIWRYIRFRNGSNLGTTRETGVILNNTSNWIFDHCSWSFCENGALEMEANRGNILNGTAQRNIVSECGTGMIMGNDITSNGNFEVGDMTSMLNLWVDLSHRSPNIGGNFYDTGRQYDIVNNMHFNWKSFGTNIKSPGKPNVNHIGNYFQSGAYTWSYNYSNSGNISHHYIGASSADNNTQIYTANNYHNVINPNDTGDNRLQWRKVGGNGSDTNNPFTTLDNSYFVDTPFPSLDPTYVIQTPTSARADVLSDVGANKYLNADGTFGIYMDSFDIMKISNVINGVSSSPYDKSTYVSQLSAIVADMPKNTRPAGYDTDGDGMADIWEKSMFGNLTKDGTGDTDGDGYTDLEEFLNLVD